MSNPSIPGPQPSDIIQDARAIFDKYLEATPNETFRRSVPIAPEVWLYPDPTIQTDMAVFSVVFACVWSAIGAKTTFTSYFNQRPDAFDFLRRIITPSASNRRAGFWQQASSSTSLLPVQSWGDAEAHLLSRTLRNGFSHFNFRYVNLKPTEYFARHRLAVPAVVVEPDIADNYRIFIYDNKMNCGFLDANSDSRLVAVQFECLRYALFRFLVSLFIEPGDPPYTDIITLQQIR